MYGRGAKGSVKNRIYQFWLIHLFLEKKKKRKQQKLLKKKQKEEAKKKWERELFYNQGQKKKWKLSKSPSIFRKKEGLVISLYPIEKKTDKVIAVVEKRKIGIVPKEDIQRKLTQITISSIKTIETVKKEVPRQSKEKSSLENQNNQLKGQLKQIKKLQNQYQSIVKKKPKASKLIVTIPNINKKIKVETTMAELAQIESLCRQKIKYVEMELSSTIIEKKENLAIIKEEIKFFPPNLKKTETASKKLSEENIEIKIAKLKTEDTQMRGSKKAQEKVISDSLSSKNKIENKIKMGMKAKNKTSVFVLAGGTLIAFPALIQLGTFHKKKISKKKAIEKEEPLSEINYGIKREQGANNIELEEFLKKTEIVQEEKENLRLKLYKTKLHASKEAEILIQSEINKQRDYLKYLNEKVNTLDITVKKKYHFKGIHHLVANVLKLTLGIFTIPFSRKKIFGTVVGITLINNSIRGLKNSFRKEEQVSYIQFKDLSKMIYSEKVALIKTRELIIDSLRQLVDLKNELENQFYGKVPYQEYEQMKDKIEAIEKTLLNKQKEIEKAQDNLEKVEEKNKVKAKRLQEKK